MNLDNLIGKYYKILVQESDHDKPYIIFGTIKDVDHDAGLITIESAEGVGCINIKAIKAIRPRYF